MTVVAGNLDLAYLKFVLKTFKTNFFFLQNEYRLTINEQYNKITEAGRKRTMRFKEDQKKAIQFYILGKISEKCDNISRTTAEAFSINQNTAHTYINELAEKGIIRRVKRGQYELIKEEYRYELKRERGELDSDIAVYENCMFPHVKELRKNLQEIWSYAFSEMINNAIDHSFSENVYVAVWADYLNTTVGITDEGVGIFEKIREHFGFSSLDEAICELMKGKLTTDPERHSGEGIFFSSKMMDSFLYFPAAKCLQTINLMIAGSQIFREK